MIKLVFCNNFNNIYDELLLFLGKTPKLSKNNEDIVKTDKNYDYNQMESDIKELAKRYSFIGVNSAGKSLLGKELYYLKIGNGRKKIFYNGSHHGDDWITSLLLLKFIENFSYAYSENKRIGAYNINKIFNTCTIYILPMINPDGVDLVINGLKEEHPYYEQLIKYNNGSLDFSGWSSNARGVDISRNYDANWHKWKASEAREGVFGPKFRWYSGEFPESEPETKAVVNLILKENFDIVISYHCNGKQIYYGHDDYNYEYKHIAVKMSKLSGYKLIDKEVNYEYSSLKYWFIKEFNKPSFRIKVGKSNDILSFEEAYKENIRVLLHIPLLVN